MSNKSSVIDYTSETSYSDSNLINSDIDTQKMYKKLSKHKVVGTRYDSSTESIKKYLDNTKFERICVNSNTSFYEMNRLNSIDFNELYNILLLSTYIIFVDNIKLIKKNKKNYFNILKSKHLIDTEFPGCTFLPFEAVTMLKKNLNKLNNSIFNAELNGTTIYMNDMICYSMMFNEDEIIKNCLYKKMEITDTIIFIPIEIYNLKQTEYKLRGFCQIVEELGAKQIDITFKNINSTETTKSYDMTIGADIELIAGNLGLSTTNKDTNNTNYSYNLTYPTNSNIILSEKTIKNKIKRKKFIVSDSIYRSTLELQYLVQSRCRHLIDTYSTVFTFDNNNIIDKSIYMKLKSHGIELGGSIKNYNNIKNNIQIITKVTFVSLLECKNLINGNNVSLDETGFNHIIETIKNDNELFEKNGIYKIMSFINMYLHRVMKYSNSKHYNTIYKVLNKIKKELTLEEYANLLCNYFNKNSQWIHFTNFIDLLGKKVQSYDKLGYIVMMYNTKADEKLNTLICFIQQLSIKYSIEDKFWKMLQPYNMSLKNDLENKLLNEYGFNNNDSWYNMNMLIECIKSYTINFSANMDEKLKQLITNMEVGYKYWEFYTNIVPFILHIARSLYNTPDDILILNIFEKSLNINSFMVCKIDNMSDLKNYIEKKIKLIINALELKNSITYRIEINNFLNIFTGNKIQSTNDETIIPSSIMINQTNEYSVINNYISKKIKYIMKNKTILNVKKMLNLSDSMISENNVDEFIYKIFTYNEKIDLKKLPINYIGFEMIMNNVNSGLYEDEFKKLMIPFLCNNYNIDEINYIKDNLTIENFKIYCTSYYETIQFIDKMIEEHHL